MTNSVVAKVAGTYDPYFRIGATGATVYTGTTDPTVTPPVPPLGQSLANSDLYIRVLTGSESFWQRRSGSWVNMNSWNALISVPSAISAVGALTPAADRLAYFTGASTAALTTLTTFGRSLIDDADAATARGTLQVPFIGGDNFTGEIGVTSIIAAGGATNINLPLKSKGTGSINFNTNSTNLQFLITHTASAVNWLNATGNVTGSGPILYSDGSDTDVGIRFRTKGDGGMSFFTGTNQQFLIGSAGIGVTTANYLMTYGGATGNGATLQSNGSDTNVNLNLLTKGSGSIPFYTGGSLVSPQFRITHTGSSVNFINVTGGVTGSPALMSSDGSDTDINIHVRPKGLGTFLINRNVALPPAPINETLLHVVGLDAANNRILVDTFGGTAALITGRSIGGTAAIPSGTPINSTCFSMGGSGYGSTGIINATKAIVSMIATETWTDAANGVRIVFATTPNGSTTRADRFMIDHNGHLLPGADNTYNLGNGSFRMNTIFAGTGTINTSDRDAKQDIRELTEAEVRVAKRLVKLVRAYRFIDAVNQKGDDARIHFGVIAQDVLEAFEAEGLDGFRYGLLCRDEIIEDDPVYDAEKDSTIHTYTNTGRYRLGVRYDELSMFVLSTLAG